MALEPGRAAVPAQQAATQGPATLPGEARQEQRVEGVRGGQRPVGCMPSVLRGRQAWAGFEVQSTDVESALAAGSDALLRQ